MEEVKDCAEGAKVLLKKGGKIIAETRADNFGDFKFDGLEENSGTYRLEILFKEFESRNLDVELNTSRNVGTVHF
jgi:hypothetical protein